MSFVDDLLVVLSSYHGGYRAMRRMVRGYPAARKNAKQPDRDDNYLRVTLSRLRRRGLTENKGGLWSLTQKGKEYLASKLRHRKYGDGENKKKSKQMIIAFDVPEKYRRERDWLRIELKNLGFAMMQKSVWYGLSPLPQDFISSLNDLKILKFIKFFDAKEHEIV